jgi:hypothetical protein
MAKRSAKVPAVISAAESLKRSVPKTASKEVGDTENLDAALRRFGWSDSRINKLSAALKRAQLRRYSILGIRGSDAER